MVVFLRLITINFFERVMYALFIFRLDQAAVLTDKTSYNIIRLYYDKTWVIKYTTVTGNKVTKIKVPLLFAVHFQTVDERFE